MIVGVDLDETLNDMIQQMLPLYNAAYSDNLAFSDITAYDITKFIKPDCENFFGEFCSDAFMAGLNCRRRDVEALTFLQKECDLYFVTAGYAETIPSRHRWLAEMFPFYDGSQLIACRNKQLLKLDYLIDDCAENLKELTGKGILIDKPWNRTTPAVLPGEWFVSSIPLRVETVANAVTAILAHQWYLEKRR